MDRPPTDVDAAIEQGLFRVLAHVPAETVEALWREREGRHVLMQLFAATLEDGPPMTEDPPLPISSFISWTRCYQGATQASRFDFTALWAPTCLSPRLRQTRNRRLSWRPMGPSA